MAESTTAEAATSMGSLSDMVYHVASSGDERSAGLLHDLLRNQRSDSFVEPTGLEFVCARFSKLRFVKA